MMKSMDFRISKYVFFEFLGSKMIAIEFGVSCDVFILKYMSFGLILV